jgi:hypothetical protein
MFIIGWFVFSIAVGYFATSKGRDPGRWFVIALIISPLIAGILLLISQDISEQEALKDGQLKKCPHCAENVKKEAIKCKHCGADLPLLA